MVAIAPVRTSLRFQFVVAIGLVIVVLMGVISLTVLFQTRTLILDQQARNAESVARSFSIPLMDALILGDQIRSIAGDLLENHIRQFVGGEEGVLYVSVLGGAGRIIAHSDPSLYNTVVRDPVTLRVGRAVAPLSSYLQGEAGEWVLETVVPLQVGGQRWGALLIGFDAEPTRRQIGRLFVLLFILTLLGTAVTLGVLYYLTDRITASLRELVAEVDRVDFENEAPMTMRPPANEIGYLVRHFEMLKRRVVQSRRQLAAAQHQMYQAEKLASIGRLAAGVAHEVNNPLNGIRFCVYGMQKEPADTAQTERYLELINDGLEHIESVVQNLLRYGRHRPAAFQEVNLNDQLRTVLDLLDFQVRDKGITVQLALDPELPAIHADPTLIQEMLMNLVLNSVDAVSRDGTIIIRTGPEEDHRIFLTVTDNGSGVAPEHLPHIFEPFFTTKETGQGTGLGLAVTLGIVEQHKGAIRVDSKPGRRTTFTVTLPREAA